MAEAERLDAALPGVEDVTLADAVPDPAAQADFEAAEARTFNAQLRQTLEASIDTLKPAEAHPVRGRPFAGKTLQALGDELGVSRERARQLEARALRRLRGRPALQAYREEITSRAYRGTSFAAWKANGSVPERWAEWAEAKEAQRRRDEERRIMDELARFGEECGIWADEPGSCTKLAQN